MTYHAQEGIDYIVDLYAVAEVSRDAEAEDIKKAINQRTVEFHPDRLEGMAPELKARGEQVTRILNKARGILLNPEKRQDYDDILSNWTESISTDGTPIITMTRHQQAEAALRSTAEVKAELGSDDARVDQLAGYSESSLTFLEKMVAKAGDDVPEDLREQYENALLQYDRNLSIKEAQRVDLLGLPSLESRKYAASLGYGEETTLAIEATKATKLEELKMAAIANTAGRLALLAGETPVETSTDLVDASTIQLPDYFDAVAEQVQDIAQKRQEIVEKRLSIFEPAYPEAELQAEAQLAVVIGIGRSDLSWFAVSVDAETNNVVSMEMPAHIRELLEGEHYRQVIKFGFNVMTYKPLEQIDVETQLNDAIQKYYDKYYPEDTPE